MDKPEHLRRFSAAVEAAIAAKSAHDAIAATLRACVAEQLQAGGLYVLEAGRARLIAEAVNDVVTNAIRECARDALASVEEHVDDAVNTAVRIVLDRIRNGDDPYREAGPTAGP